MFLVSEFQCIRQMEGDKNSEMKMYVSLNNKLYFNRIGSK